MAHGEASMRIDLLPSWVMGLTSEGHSVQAFAVTKIVWSRWSRKEDIGWAHEGRGAGICETQLIMHREDGRPMQTRGGVGHLWHPSSFVGRGLWVWWGTWLCGSR